MLSCSSATRTCSVSFIDVSSTTMIRICNLTMATAASEKAKPPVSGSQRRSKSEWPLSSISSRGLISFQDHESNEAQMLSATARLYPSASVARKALRYHVGESMLPSMRHFLKFIDAYEKWDAHGFNVKVRYEKRKLNVRGHRSLTSRAERRCLPP